eukprot:2731768-Ditylum_brightwellii.AAC.1
MLTAEEKLNTQVDKAAGEFLTANWHAQVFDPAQLPSQVADLVVNDAVITSKIRQTLCINIPTDNIKQYIMEKTC